MRKLATNVIVGTLLVIAFFTIPPKVSIQVLHDGPGDYVSWEGGPQLIDEKQVESLAKNAYHEARGEHLAGMLGTMFVVRNRKEHKDFPNTYCSVVYDAVVVDGRPVIHGCHFSWYCDDKPDTINNQELYEYVQGVARIFLYNSQNILDFTNGALYYHSVSVSPDWASPLHLTARIDNHLYYDKACLKYKKGIICDI